jgi:hypothetical protein
MIHISWIWSIATAVMDQKLRDMLELTLAEAPPLDDLLLYATGLTVLLFEYYSFSSVTVKAAFVIPADNFDPDVEQITEYRDRMIVTELTA